MLFPTRTSLAAALFAALSAAVSGPSGAAPPKAAAPKGAASQESPSKAPSLDLRLEVARQWEEKGEYDKAVQELRLYLSEHPENPGPIYARVGGLRLKQGNFKLAGENFKIALARDPNLVEARAGLALAYEKQGEKAKAEEERKKLAAMSGARSAPVAAVPGPAGSETKPGSEAKPHTEGGNPSGTPPAAAGSAPEESAPEEPPHAAGLPRPGPATPVPAPVPAPAKANAAAGATTNAAAEDGDGGFSPALDSGSSKGPEGIYADKDFLAALELYKAGKLDAMAGPLRRCLSRHPGHPGAYYLGGVMRYEKGDLAKALFNFKRALGYPDRGFNAHYYMGRICQRQERLPAAAAEYREYLKATPSPAGRKSAEGYLARMGEGNVPATPAPAGGDGKAGTGAETAAARPDAAGKAPGSGLKEKTAKEAAHESGGKASAEPEEGPAGGPEAKTGNLPAKPKAPPLPVPPSEAKALVLDREGGLLFLIPDPESASGKKLREAHSLVANDRFEKAIDALKEVMLGYGGSDNAAAAGLDLASVYLRLGLWDQARERAADHAGPTEAPRDSAKYADAARYFSALANLGLKDGAKAEKDLLKIKPGSPNGPAQEEIEHRLAQAGALAQDPKKWSGYLEKAFANAKDPVRKAGYARDLGSLHAKYGALDKAMAWYGKAGAGCKDAADSALAESCAEAQLRLADLAYRKKDWKGAMAQYRKFAAQWPRHKESAWVHYQMANIYKVSGNFESALNEYKRVIDNYPDSYWASQAKWKREDAIWRKEYEEVLD
jgi:tetratricopeptide (TPR) repeat protein